MLDLRSEIITTGIDEQLQLVGSDPYAHIENVGLRVPFGPTATVGKVAPLDERACPEFPGPLLNRYLFMLCAFNVNYKQCARLRGWRELVTIGTKQTSDAGSPRVVEQEVLSPFWKFADGNVSFHLMDMGPPGGQGLPLTLRGPIDLNNFKFRWASSPALLYDTGTVMPAADLFYVDLTTYVAPHQGKPYGAPLIPGMSVMYDLRTPWRSGGLPWHAIDIPITGPRTVALFASVRQTNPATRVALTLPLPIYPEALSPEEQFLLNFPNAIYWRVGGGLIVDY